jgi:hypothetical protein
VRFSGKGMEIGTFVVFFESTSPQEDAFKLALKRWQVVDGWGNHIVYVQPND